MVVRAKGALCPFCSLRVSGAQCFEGAAKRSRVGDRGKVVFDDAGFVSYTWSVSYQWVSCVGLPAWIVEPVGSTQAQGWSSGSSTVGTTT